MELQRCFSMLNGLRRMLRDRGYSGVPMPMTKKEFLGYVDPQTLHIDRGKMSFLVRDKQQRTVAVHINPSPKLGAPDAKANIVNPLLREGIKRLILVTVRAVTASIVTELSRLQHYETFTEEELSTLAIIHNDVPRHIRLSPEARDAYLRESGIDEDHFPRILATDPVCKYFGFRPGDLIKIIRSSPTAGRSVTYRMVY